MIRRAPTPVHEGDKLQIVVSTSLLLSIYDVGWSSWISRRMGFKILVECRGRSSWLGKQDRPVP
ncbi:MAG: hypothetical protein N2C14_27835, partial [Planctomycetales bacterium]